MNENRVMLCGNMHPAEFSGQSGKGVHLRPAHEFDPGRIVAAHHAIERFPDLTGNFSQSLQLSPLLGNVAPGFCERVVTSQSAEEHRAAITVASGCNAVHARQSRVSRAELTIGLR